MSEQTSSGNAIKQQTIVDGSSTVTQNTEKYIPGAPGKSAAKMGNDVAIGARQAYFKQHGSYPPCINTNCRSYGRPHDNCLCYGNTSDAGINYGMAKGGVVDGHFCSTNRKHNPKCEYYAEGGDVLEQQAPQQFQDNPEDTLGHAAVEHGLMGLLTDVGHKKLTDPEKHVQKLHESFAEPDREKASEKLSSHPLAGMTSPRKLHPIMDRLAGPVATQEPQPEAFRNSVEYLNSAVRGHSDLDRDVGELFGSKGFSEKIEPDMESRERLKKHLEGLQENPSSMLDIGGSLGHYLPEHGAALGAHSAIAVNYLNSLKPTQAKSGPLDEISPIDKGAEGRYHRALEIAQRPLMALHYAKEGTLLPQDIKTLSTIYPGLMKSMVNKIGEELIEAQTKGTEIPYKQRISIGMLIGQPLDSTMQPMALQAIMRANAGAQRPQSQPKKATGVELKQINKVDAMAETKLQKRQLGEKP